MNRVDRILDLIDGALAGEGPDGMRWTPDPPKTEESPWIPATDAELAVAGWARVPGRIYFTRARFDEAERTVRHELIEAVEVDAWGTLARLLPPEGERTFLDAMVELLASGSVVLYDFGPDSIDEQPLTDEELDGRFPHAMAAFRERFSL